MERCRHFGRKTKARVRVVYKAAFGCQWPLNDTLLERILSEAFNVCGQGKGELRPWTIEFTIIRMHDALTNVPAGITL